MQIVGPMVAASPELWRERDLPPFAAAIAAGVDAVEMAKGGVSCPADLLDDPAGPLAAACWLPLRQSYTSLLSTLTLQPAPSAAFLKMGSSLAMVSLL